MDEKVIKEQAFEWGIDYKPWEEDMSPQDYAMHGYVQGAQWMLKQNGDFAKVISQFKLWLESDWAEIQDGSEDTKLKLALRMQLKLILIKMSMAGLTVIPGDTLKNGKDGKVVEDELVSMWDSPQAKDRCTAFGKPIRHIKTAAVNPHVIKSLPFSIP